MTAARTGPCAILRNGIRRLVEWQANYELPGVSELVIHDNSGTDGTTESLRALDEAGALIHPDWSQSMGARPQRLTHEHARRHSDVDWLGFFDADEVLVLHQDATLAELLARFPPDVSAEAANRIVFGTAGRGTVAPFR